MLRQYILNKDGQVLLTLILVMTVALAIGLSVVQKSLTDVSTATKVEDSQRAFSAAEAGIEKGLNGDMTTKTFTENNSQITSLEDSGSIPALPPSQTQQKPLEYPPLAKEEVGQIWLADPDPNVVLPGCSAIDATKHVPVCYKQSTLSVYWGSSSSDKAALELTLIYYNGTSYVSRKWYLDQVVRTPANNFDQVQNCAGYKPEGFTTTYQCYVLLGNLPSNLIMLRVRLLYNITSQPIAVLASGTCGRDCSLPPQYKILTSTGTAGEVQRKVKVFQSFKAIPTFFDYALFSNGEIKK